MPDSLAGKRITVVGLGRFGGGIGVTRWLCGQGARVTVSDQAEAASLAESVQALAGLDVTLHLGGHRPADFLEADLLVVSPAVPRDNPQFVAARGARVPWTTEINLFLQRCGGRVIGITGSVGKSTTTAMIGDILSRKFHTLVGGNIGKSLLDDLPRIDAQSVVVLELSSFQLEDLPQVGISPGVAVVTNLTPNHLDRHGTMEAYGQAKKNIFRFQHAQDCLVLNSSCPITSAWAKEARGKVAFFDGRADAGGVCGAGVSSAMSNAGQAWRQTTAAMPPQLQPFSLCLPGGHNQANAQAAWAAVRELGISREEAAAALAKFAGLPHRLQFVCERRGVKYFNDSKCTTPEGCIVAVNSFPARTAVVLVGGYDKHVSFDVMGKVLAEKAKAVVALGATRDSILAAIEAHRCDSLPRVQAADDFAAAVAAAVEMADSGDNVLLSPACASYDMFVNYEQRGQRFIDLLTRLA